MRLKFVGSTVQGNKTHVVECKSYTLFDPIARTVGERDDILDGVNNHPEVYAPFGMPVMEIDTGNPADKITPMRFLLVSMDNKSTAFVYGVPCVVYVMNDNGDTVDTFSNGLVMGSANNE